MTGFFPRTSGLVGLGLTLALFFGCSDRPLSDAPLLARAKGIASCVPEDSSRLSAPTFHHVSVDGTNDFDPGAERAPAGQKGTYQSFATWDDCRLYLGYAGLTLGRSASPHRFLAFYLNTDPLGQYGTPQPRRATPTAHGLPFHADYLVEVRTDGKMTKTADGQHVYHGNAQVFKNVDEWEAGLTSGWEPIGRDALAVAQDPDRNYLELSIARESLGSPCAVEVVAWVTDIREGRRFGYWPPPNGARSTPDSVALDYYGFPLVPGVQPSASIHLNRIDYSAAGTSCAEGKEDHQ